MSSKTARVHNHVSNRARNKNAGERKAVFKGVLDNPFRIQWYKRSPLAVLYKNSDFSDRPAVPINVQKDVLTAVLAQLSGVTVHASRKRKHTPTQEQSLQKKRKHDDEINELAEAVSSTQPAMAVDDILPSKSGEIAEPPSISKHLVIGINQVTKRLEEQVRTQRVTLLATNPPPKEPQSLPLRLILVCRADINPPILVDHLPHLVAAFNSLRPEEAIKLVPLHPGAELELSKVVGLRRMSVLGFDSRSPDLETILGLLAGVQSVSATWLTSSAADKTLVPTHIKQVRTTTPKDLKAEKQRRTKEKALKKKQRRLSSGNKVA
ncbi:hypothetical protein H0H92_002125 [Tricholoma furcatifolium]|nr:hypothetical protein H0H92_002125 [Tricholoma furcatifolium]